MCDIYTCSCNHINCIFSIELHLEDFETDHDEIEIYCRNHIPEDRGDGVVWKFHQGKSGSKFFMRSLTQNARNHWEGNCYNGECAAIEVFGRSLKSAAIA